MRLSCRDTDDSIPARSAPESQYMRPGSSGGGRRSTKSSRDASDSACASERSIIGSMKVKTSITLSRELLDAVDARTGRGRGRSEFIETAVKAFLDKSVREERASRDLEILRRRATRLNREAADVLAYQVIP